MLEGVRYLAARTLRRHLIGPRQLRKFDAQVGTVIHRSPFDLTFELVPGEFVDRNIVYDGIYEERFLSFAASLLTPDSVVVDIGANIGNHALFLARKCAAVHCFEPNPRALERLARNISLNGFTNIIVHPFGLGERDETARFYDNVGENLGCGSFVAPNGPTRELELPIRQAGTAISELNLDRLDFIKIDIEHMEEIVLRALGDILERYRPIISFEFDGTTRSPDEFERIRRALKGFDLFEPRFSPSDGTIVERIRWNLRSGGIPDLVPIEVPEARWYENIFAIPTERRGRPPKKP